MSESTNTCPCGQPSKDATICTDCESRLVEALAEVPALSHEFETVLARLNKQGGGSIGFVTSSPTRPLPYDVAASEAGGELKSVMVSWLRLVLDENAERMTLPSDTLADIARWLLGQVPWLRLHDAAGDAVDELTEAVGRLRHVVYREIRQRHYRGRCGAEWTPEEEALACCVADLYTRRPDAAYVGCEQCGETHNAEVLRQHIRTEAGSRLYTRAEMLEMIPVLTKHAVTVRLMDAWIEKSRLVPHGERQEGGEQVPTFLTDDLLTLIAAEWPTIACRQCGIDVVRTGKPGQPSAFCSEDCRREHNRLRMRTARRVA